VITEVQFTLRNSNPSVVLLKSLCAAQTGNEAFLLRAGLQSLVYAGQVLAAGDPVVAGACLSISYKRNWLRGTTTFTAYIQSSDTFSTQIAVRL